jgi:hypothetical protein
MSQSNLSEPQNSVAPDQNRDDRFVHTWIAHLLHILDGSLSDEARRSVLKECSLIHYRDINMEEFISKYHGNLPGFIEFLANTWQWKVVYDPAQGVIIADENKPTCVCPIVRLSAGAVSGILCHCSEGFAERMFASVMDRPVKAQVLKSILRGDPSCVYRIDISTGNGSQA